MVKLKLLLYESKILIPRRTPEEREKTLIAEQYRMIQRYIKDGCRGDLILRNSPIKILPDNLTHTNGSVDLAFSKIEDLNNLERVDGYLSLYKCKNLKSLGKLNIVSTLLNLDYSGIETLNNLEYVYSSLWLHDTPQFKSFGKLKHVGRDLDISKSNILNLLSIEDIEKHINVKHKIITVES
jgi:hypothetical protein